MSIASFRVVSTSCLVVVDGLFLIRVEFGGNEQYLIPPASRVLIGFLAFPNMYRMGRIAITVVETHPCDVLCIPEIQVATVVCLHNVLRISFRVAFCQLVYEPSWPE